MVQHAANDLRNSVWALRVAPLEGRTFGESLATMADHVADGDAPRIAVHHAECARVDVRVASDAATRLVTLTVHDDGRGFDPAQAAGTAQGHFGLQVMRERMEGMGGRLDIETAPGRGTTITATVTPDTE